MTNSTDNNTPPSRRDVLQTAAAAGMSAAAASALNISMAEAAEGKGKKPNIIMVLPDQYRPDAFGFMNGMGCAYTPTIDKLAARGTNFATNWVQSPVCRPSRLSMISGLYVKQHGMGHNLRDDFDPAMSTMMKHLKKAGYTTANIGKSDYKLPKWLLEGGLHGLENSSYDNRKDYDFYEKFGWDFVHDNAGRNRDSVENYHSEYTDYLKENGWLQTFQRQVRQTWPGEENRWDPIISLMPQEFDITSFMGDETIKWLKGHDTNEPFFLTFAPHTPHVPMMCDPEWANYYIGKEVELGPRNVPDPKTAIWEEEIKRALISSGHPGLPDELVKNSARIYLGMCSLIDQKLGELWQVLEERGMADNTWFIMLSDHGEMLGDHHMMGKSLFYKTSVGIPGIVSPPKNASVKQVDSPVGMIDMTATILDIAGADPMPDSDGVSLKACLDGAPVPRDVVYSEISNRKGDRHYVAVRTADYRYTMEWFSKAPCEFFDMKNDPNELNNRVVDPARKAKVDEHHALLMDFMKDSVI